MSTKDEKRVLRQIARLSRELDRLELASVYRGLRAEVELQKYCEENNLIYFPLNY